MQALHAGEERVRRDPEASCRSSVRLALAEDRLTGFGADRPASCVPGSRPRRRDLAGPFAGRALTRLDELPSSAPGRPPRGLEEAESSHRRSRRHPRGPASSLRVIFVLPSGAARTGPRRHCPRRSCLFQAIRRSGVCGDLGGPFLALAGDVGDPGQRLRVVLDDRLDAVHELRERLELGPLGVRGRTGTSTSIVSWNGTGVPAGSRGGMCVPTLRDRRCRDRRRRGGPRVGLASARQRPRSADDPHRRPLRSTRPMLHPITSRRHRPGELFHGRCGHATRNPDRRPSGPSSAGGRLKSRSDHRRTATHDCWAHGCRHPAGRPHGPPSRSRAATPARSAQPAVTSLVARPCRASRECGRPGGIQTPADVDGSSLREGQPANGRGVRLAEDRAGSPVNPVQQRRQVAAQEVREHRPSPRPVRPSRVFIGLQERLVDGVRRAAVDPAGAERARVAGAGREGRQQRAEHRRTTYRGACSMAADARSPPPTSRSVSSRPGTTRRLPGTPPWVCRRALL